MCDYGFLSKNFLLDYIGATIVNERSKAMELLDFIVLYINADEEVKRQIEALLEASQQQLEPGE